MKRVIQREVQDRLADFILAGEARPEQTEVLAVVDDGFVLRAEKAQEGQA